MTFLEFLLAAGLAYSLWLNVQSAQRRLEKLEDKVDELEIAWEEFEEEDDGPDGGETVRPPKSEVTTLRKVS